MTPTDDRPSDLSGGSEPARIPVAGADLAIGRQFNLLEILLDRMPMGVGIYDHNLSLIRSNLTWTAFLNRYSRLRGLTEPGIRLFDSASAVKDEPAWKRVLDGETVREDAIRLEDDGLVSFWDSVLTPLKGDGPVLGIVGVTIDVTARVKAYQTMAQRAEERLLETEHRHKVAESLGDILAALNSNRSLPELLCYIVNQACQLLAADAGAAFRIDQDRQVTVCDASDGLPSDLAALVMQPIRSPAAATRPLFNHGPMGIPDLPAYYGDLDGDEASVQDRDYYRLLSEHYLSGLIAPVTIKDEVYGGLVFYYRNRRNFTEEDLWLVVKFADQVALALENARLRQRDEQAAVMAERNRLARDLHDAVTQTPDLYRNIFEAASDGLIISDLETGLVVEANPVAGAMLGYAREEFIGLHSTAFIHPDSLHRFSQAAQAAQSSGVFEALMVCLRRDKSTFYVEMRGTAFTYQDRPGLLCVVRDVSERVQAERLLEQQAETRTREQLTLLEISHTLASTLELQPGLILNQLRGIVEYTHAELFGLDDSTLIALAVRGPQQLEQAVLFRIRLKGPETLAALFNGHRPIRIADVWSADSAAQFLRSLLDDEAAVLLEGMQAWMWVPLAVKGRVIGGVSVAHTERNYFTVHHADLALMMANQVAITMVNAELYEQAQTLAVIEERQRMAQKLHDAVNQSLFSASLIAEVLPRLWEKDPEEGRRSLEDVRRLTRGALAEMRMLLVELRPSALTDSELSDLLRLLANALTGRTNIPVAVSVAGQGTLPAEAQVAFYRLCQEGLSNIAKHAEASRVEIHLQYDADAGAVELRLRDDGRGFDPEHTPSGHYGLSMMRERADAVGAILSITSQPGHGTEIVIRWTEAPHQEAL